ncbi:MAG TPA: glycosyl hydrolase family 8 [Stellaceae bacterium]|nr:glycosyl hydrolase family 8 [Stellaceae bacterium]
MRARLNAWRSRLLPVLAAGLVLVAFAVTARAQDNPLAGEWSKYRDRFVADDGRVRDTGNKDVSHTEGQGWAMLFAESFDDRATFDRIWQWTRDTLQRADSALFSWRWDPHGDKPIADTNNATDGDMLIAWSLARAARHWQAPEYRIAARRIAGDIRRKLLTRVGGRLVLLPGLDGFAHDDGSVMLNPSYYVFPALEEFPRLDGSPEWSRVRRDGLSLLAKARFGAWKLTPDWIAVDKKGDVAPASRVPPRFGYDAIRVPLYLVWGREATAPRLAAVVKFWKAFTDKPVPAWVDVTDGATAPYPAPNGFHAIMELVDARLDAKPPPLPVIQDGDDYYSASLILLADLARRAAGR